MTEKIPLGQFFRSIAEFQGQTQNNLAMQFVFIDHSSEIHVQTQTAVELQMLVQLHLADA